MRNMITFSDETKIGFVTGRFDNYAVMFEDAEGNRTAAIDIGCSLWARDYEYFATFLKFYGEYGNSIYHDFRVLYNRTTATVKPNTTFLIELMAKHYGDDALPIQKLFTLLYYTMVAEENKNFAVLGKRIKMLGIHQVIFDGLTPIEAANFSRGKKWNELDKIMKARGF